jgi:hypothetical protein
MMGMGIGPRRRSRRAAGDEPLVLEKSRSNEDQREAIVCLDFAMLLGANLHVRQRFGDRFLIFSE